MQASLLLLCWSYRWARNLWVLIIYFSSRLCCPLKFQGSPQTRKWECCLVFENFSLFFFIFKFLFLLYFTLQYCIGFAIHWHESATGVQEFPIMNPLPPATPYHLSGSSSCTSPKHPVSCIEHRLAIRFSHDWKPELKETRVPQCSSQYCLFHLFSNWSICKNYLELFYTSDLSILPHFSFTLSFNFISIVS